MSTSSPVRTRKTRRPSRPPQAENTRPTQAANNPSPRSRAAITVARSILMVVAAVSVLATSNYFAYLIGRKQVTYEELRRQVDLVIQLVDQKRAEEDAPAKQQQDRLEQNAPGLSGLTTSTTKGKTTAVAPAPAEKVAPAVLNDAAVALPDYDVRSQPPGSSVKATPKHRAAQRGPRRKVAPPQEGAAAAAFAEQPAQSTNAPAPMPDRGLAGQ